MDAGPLLRSPPSPGPNDQPHLVLIVGERVGRTFPIRQEATIGRALDCAVRLDDESVSRYHSRLRRQAGGDFLVEDLGSRNGTWVNGVPVESKVLAFGDRLRIGHRTVLLFTHVGDVESQLLHQQRMESLGELASGIAHDFNNLLAAVLGNSSYLLSLESTLPLGSPEVRASLADVEAAAARAGELTRRLLDFARRGPHEERPVDVQQLLSDVLSILRRSFPSKIKVELEVEPRLSVLGDRSQLHQALVNLCVNARDAMPEGGRLQIVARRLLESEGGREPRVSISVTDTGVGMDEDTQKRAFEPFYTTKPRGQGTGLGLSTVYGVVQRHGGEVRVKSTPGHGASIELLLPPARSDRQVLVETQSCEVAVPARSGTAMVVDLDPLHQRSAARLFAQLGFGVVTAGSADEARAHAAKQGPSLALALLDLDLADAAPEALARELSIVAPSLRVLTTSGSRPSGDGLLNGAAMAFLPKPYDFKALRRALGGQPTSD
jgi:two-component system cell cycle sensor histidine kinase/response regulator CckA